MISKLKKIFEVKHFISLDVAENMLHIIVNKDLKKSGTKNGTIIALNGSIRSPYTTIVVENFMDWVFNDLVRELYLVIKDEWLTEDELKEVISSGYLNRNKD